jgi:hypothetical protein
MHESWAVLFKQPVLGRPTGAIPVTDVLMRVLLFLPPHQSTLLAVGAVSKVWRAASERLPQWCLVPELFNVNVCLTQSFVLTDAPSADRVTTRQQYIAVMKHRSHVYHAIRTRLETTLEAAASSRNFRAPLRTCAIMFCAIAVAFGTGVGVAFAHVRSKQSSVDDPSVKLPDDPQPLDALAFVVLIISGFVALAAGGIVSAFNQRYAAVRHHDRNRVRRSVVLVAVAIGCIVHITTPLTLGASRLAMIEILRDRPAVRCGKLDGVPVVPFFVYAEDLSSWDVAPWVDVA